MKTLRDVLARLTEERLDLARRYIENLATAIGSFERANGRVPLAELSAGQVRKMMRRVLDAGRGATTVNNYRRTILYLWECARRLDYEYPGTGWECPPSPRSEISKLKQVVRVPTAWQADQFAALVAACRSVRTRRGWGPIHWLALVMTVYDTSLRIGCLLRSTLHQLHSAELRLLVPGELQKGRADTWQSLHAETVRLLERLPRDIGDDRLFPWPYRREQLWRKFEREILIPAGLPHGRRDKFHRIRRTSYSLVAKAFGVAAASQHAAHKEDLSRFYLDPTFLDQPNPLDALPRPA